MQNNELSDRIRAVEDKLALKELVDTFSILADKKDTQPQTLLFTENATVESYVGDSLLSVLEGRQQIGTGFGAYLNTFETVYHLNGQQTVVIAGDTATGIAYCHVTLIELEDNQKVQTTSGVQYQDDYVRVNGRWLIAKRVATFAWQNKQIA